MTRIESREKWNRSGVRVVAGLTYRYQAAGHWKDWYLECDADGYSNVFMGLVGWTKRVPGAKWFQLIGVVDQDMRYVLRLGREGTFTAPASGELWAFANDAGIAYWNNSGAVELQVQEV